MNEILAKYEKAIRINYIYKTELNRIEISNEDVESRV